MPHRNPNPASTKSKTISYSFPRLKSNCIFIFMRRTLSLCKNNIQRRIDTACKTKHYQSANIVGNINFYFIRQVIKFPSNKIEYLLPIVIAAVKDKRSILTFICDLLSNQVSMQKCCNFKCEISRVAFSILPGQVLCGRAVCGESSRQLLENHRNTYRAISWKLTQIEKRYFRIIVIKKLQGHSSANYENLIHLSSQCGRQRTVMSLLLIYVALCGILQLCLVIAICVLTRELK